ncbi:hypothetical protein [Niabella hibiscisoli]|nr:hypothetical protein [Niabella hibiscisoli]MCH5718485.1 hypothetical protein [Niabella hibiscisoli]
MKKIIAGIGLLTLIATNNNVQAQKEPGKMLTLQEPLATTPSKEKNSQ